MYQRSFLWEQSDVSSEKQDTRVPQDAPTGGPSALEKAIWAPQWCHVMRQIFFDGPITENAMLARIQYHEWSRKLFGWGTAHSYPEYSICIDGRIASVIASGRSAWLTFCTMRDYDLLLGRFVLLQLKSLLDKHDRPVKVLSDCAIRDEVMVFGWKRSWWNYLIYAAIPGRDNTFALSIDSGEENWQLFAYSADITYVSQMLAYLRQQVERDALYEMARDAGWPSFSYTPLGRAWPTILHRGSELDWRVFCAYQCSEHIRHACESLS